MSLIAIAPSLSALLVITSLQVVSLVNACLSSVVKLRFEDIFCFEFFYVNTFGSAGCGFSKCLDCAMCVFR